MAADISTSLKDWSVTEASNSPAGTTAIGANLDDNLRQIQSTVRDVWSQDSIASATTTDLGTKDAGSLSITGTTTMKSTQTLTGTKATTTAHTTPTLGCRPTMVPSG